MREKIKDLALKESDLSPRELAVQFTDTETYFVSEGETDQKTIQWIVFLSNVYRILRSSDLITSPAYVVLSAADEFRDKTTRPNELWQTDFTCLKVIGWGWFYLSTIRDDYSRVRPRPRTDGSLMPNHRLEALRDIDALARASTTSHLPTSASDAVKPF